MKNFRNNEKSLSKKKISLVLKLSILLLIFLVILYVIFGPGLRISLKRAKLKDLNVILITIDTLRADHVSIYHQGKAETPHLDKLAKQGVMFSHCLAQTPLTLPAHISILSSAYPLFHQVRDNGGFVVPQKLEFLSEILKEKGYATSAFIAAYVLHSKWGTAQGFDTFSDEFDLTKYERIQLQIEKNAEKVFDNSKKWLTKNRDKKYFCWIHLYDPHTPYEPPEPFSEKYPHHPYRGEVEYTDAQLGKFMNFLKKEGFEDQALIIITGDHGEGLGDFQEMEHGYFIYEPTVWVPLIIKAPFSFPVKQITETVEHVDLAPTILEALNIAIPQSYQGKSFLDLMFARTEQHKEFAYTESYYPRFHFGWSELKAIYHKNWKYIMAPQEELFDLSRDSRETNNLNLKESFEKKKLRERILSFIEDKSRQAIKPERAENLNQADLKRLQALGYLTTVVDTGDKTTLPDPKVKIRTYNDFIRAIALSKEKKFDQAINIMEKLIIENTDLADAYGSLGNCYFEQGRYDKAIENFYKALELNPASNFTMINLLISLKRVGKLNQAMKEAHKFIATFPRDHLFYQQLGEIYYYKKDLDNAWKYLKKAIEIESNSPRALTLAAEISFLKKDLKTARSLLYDALVINPKIRDANYLLAQIEEAEGNLKMANEFYKKELENNSYKYEAAFNLGGNLMKLDNKEEAIEYFQKTITIRPDFKMPYFIIARYYFENNKSLDQAIALCQKGISLKPADKFTLLGYFILSNIYYKRGDKENHIFYTNKGEELYKKLNKKK